MAPVLTGAALHVIRDLGHKRDMNGMNPNRYLQISIQTIESTRNILMDALWPPWPFLAVDVVISAFNRGHPQRPLGSVSVGYDGDHILAYDAIDAWRGGVATEIVVNSYVPLDEWNNRGAADFARSFATQLKAQYTQFLYDARFRGQFERYRHMGVELREETVPSGPRKGKKDYILYLANPSADAHKTVRNQFIRNLISGSHEGNPR